mmetsp:Transcript_69435/g.166461  ORF Transcript_69435/g.166461 Transcript_69435/m.166461 type:complete len:345 (+) Transcript_69435:91-1125(+)
MPGLNARLATALPMRRLHIGVRSPFCPAAMLNIQQPSTGGAVFGVSKPIQWGGCARWCSTKPSGGGTGAEPSQASQGTAATGPASSDAGDVAKSSSSQSVAHAAPDDDSGFVKHGSDNVQFTWRSALLTCLVGGASLAYYDYLKRCKLEEARAVVKHERMGTPKLGGSFELVDRKGVTRTEADYLGKYLLIYFGFVFCPDICPQEMEKQRIAVELLDAEIGSVVTPMFITVDPRRDTPAQIDDYLKEFHPRTVGLTGTTEQVKQVSRAYRVYYNEGFKASEKDYLVDHSIIHYFVGKDGKFIDFFGKNMTAREMADKMKAIILIDREKAQERKQRRGVESLDEE